MYILGEKMELYVTKLVQESDRTLRFTI